VLFRSEFFKIGHLNKVYRWGITEWMTSERTIPEIECGQFGRFYGGRFKAEVSA